MAPARRGVDRRPRRLRRRAGLRRARRGRPDGRRRRDRGSASSARPTKLGLDGVDGVEVVPTRGLDRQRRGPGAARSAPARRPRSSAPPRDVAEGRADALASHGSTGATMAAATFGLRRLQGVQRPALAVQLPVPGQARPLPRRRAPTSTSAPSTWSSSPSSAPPSARRCSGSRRPRVGLLSVGEEAGKGQRGGRRGPRDCSPARRGHRVRRQRRGPRPAGRRRRRRRHRRLHRQRRR